MTTLTISEPQRHRMRMNAGDHFSMRYLAATIGALGTLFLLLPVH
jgi:hypothetical protein